MDALPSPAPADPPVTRPPTTDGALAGRLSDLQLRATLAALGDAVLTLDEHQTVVMANAAAARLFHCGTDDLLGQPFARLVPGSPCVSSGLACETCGDSDFVSNGSVRRGDIVALRSDGQAFPVELVRSKTEIDGGRLCTAILRDLSQARRALPSAEAQGRLRASMVDTCRVGIVQIDPATRRFVAINPTFSAICGYDEAELLAMDVDRLNHPDDRLDLTKFEALLRGTATYVEDKRLLRKDGAVVWVRLSGSVVRDPGGRPTGVVGVVQDITSRRSTEREVAERMARQAFQVRLNDRLRQLAEPSAIAFEACRLLGEFIGVEHVCHAEDDGNGETATVARGYQRSGPELRVHCRYADVEPALVEALQSARTTVWSNVAQDARLSEARRDTLLAKRIGSAVVVPMHQGGRLRGCLCVADLAPRDWTRDDVALFEHVARCIRADMERARAEAEVGRTQAQLKAALDSSPDAIFITDAQGRFLQFNQAFATFHRFRDKSECPVTLDRWTEILDVYLPDGSVAPHDQWAVPRALRGETGSNVEYGLRRRDTGESWTGSYGFAPLRDEQGRIVGSVVSARDISAFKRMHADLEAAHAELQRLIAAQDQVQEQERLRIARELHDDLQQSLSAILMDVAVARATTGRPGGGDANLQALARIERLALDVTASTRRIIQDLRPQALEALGLVSALETLAASFSERTGMACDIDTQHLRAADQAKLAGVATCLYRVAQEALNNAARHSRALRLRIEFASRPPSGVRLTIRDDGVGLRPEDRAKADSYGLLGMRERVRAAGGTLEVRGTPGQGTTLEVDLPWRHPDRPA